MFAVSQRSIYGALLFGLVVSACLAFPTWAQEVDTCDPKDGLTRGPLSFTALTGSEIRCTREEDRNGVRWRYFRLRASGGSFSYSAIQEVLRGKIIELDIEAARTFKGNSPTPVFEIEPSKLKLKISLDKPLVDHVFGGNLEISPDTELTLTNDSKIIIRGTSKTNQTGSLTTIAPQLSLKKIQLSLTGAPMPFLASVSGKGAILKFSLKNGSVRIQTGTFDGHFERHGLIGPIEFGTSEYRGFLAKLDVPTIHLVVASAVLVRLGALRTSGEFAGIASPSTHLPVLIDGELQFAALEGKGPYSTDPLDLSGLRVRDLQFTPRNISSVKEVVYPSPKQKEFLLQLGATALTSSQQASVDENAQILRAITPDLLINMTPTFLRPALVANASKIGLSAKEVYFGDQEVLALTGSTAKSSLISSTDFVLRMTPTVAMGQLKVRYTVDTASLEKYQEPGWKPLSGIVEGFKDRAKAIEQAASDPNSMVLVKVPMTHSDSFDVNFSRTDPGTGITVKVIGNRTTLDSTISGSAILIDTNGLHLLASVALK